MEEPKMPGSAATDAEVVQPFIQPSPGLGGDPVAVDVDWYSRSAFAGDWVAAVAAALFGTFALT